MRTRRPVVGTRVPTSDPSPVRVWDIPRSGRTFLQIDAEHPVWRGASPPSIPPDALVKVWPPSTASDEQVRRVIDACRSAGAAGVRVAQRPSARGSQVQAQPDHASLREGGKALRSLVEGFAATTATAAGVDPEALSKRLLTALEKAGADKITDRSEASEPIYVRQVILHNWRCYTGNHTLKLKPDVYAVLARAEGEEGRSNWLGKTSLLEAIPFALWGLGAKGQEGTEDGWISHGRMTGCVLLVLSNGVTINRTGELGKRARLHLVRPDSTEARSDLAQEEIERLVGLSREDFKATVFLEQDETSRLVTMRPGERYEVLAGWMPEIGVLRAAEELLEADLDKTREEIDAADLEYRVAVTKEGFLLASADVDVRRPVEEKRALLEEKRRVVREELAAVERETEEAQHAFQKAASEAGAIKSEVQAYERAKRRFEANPPLPLADQMRQDLPVRRKAVDDARLELGVAEGNAGKRQTVVSSGFDGACPVAQGFVCPVREQVQEKVRGDSEAVQEENRRLIALEVEVRRATDAMVEAAQIIGQDDRRAREREEAQQEMQRTAAAVDKAQALPDLEILRQRNAMAYSRWHEVKARLAELNRDVECFWAAQEAAQKDRSAAEGEERLLRAAIAVVGRQGAQRAVAAGSLSEIEAGANGILAESGIDLRITLRWGRESEKRLESRCTGCWMLLPESTKVKVCPKCKTVRGPAIDDRVEVVLSDVSGGAKDLAGVALQLAAAGWLRARRGSAWGVLCVDEPFGALDPANRRGLGRHLATLLKGQHGVVQAFVVAHDAGSLDALPGRVVIVRGRDGASRPEVASSVA